MEKTLAQKCFEYGYTWAGMKVLSQDPKDLIENYKKRQLYRLYPDGSEGAIDSFDEVIEFLNDENEGFIGEEYEEGEVTDQLCPFCGANLALERIFHNKTGKDCLRFECHTEGCDTRIDFLYD